MIEAHAHIKRGARIGRGCSVGSFATVSGDPQDLHFDRATVSFVEIGDGTAVREGATVHRADGRRRLHKGREELPAHG